jgi:trehalose 6-phosphate phosphatase
MRRAAFQSADGTLPGAHEFLFSPDGEAALQSLAGARTLYAFDFDGTLAPIEARPDRVRAPGGVMRLLRSLSGLAPVAVVSGRQRADLLARLPESVQHVVGNHGNEGAAVAVDAETLAATCASWRTQLDAALAAAGAAEPGAASGVFLEDKRLSLSLHYRLARDRAAAFAWLQRAIAALEPSPRVIGGKLVFNLLPPQALTKFEALVALAGAERAERVLFVGDDDTDEIVFERAPPHWLTVRVDPARDSRARWFVHRQSGVLMLLDALVRRLAPARQRSGGTGDERR